MLKCFKGIGLLTLAIAAVVSAGCNRTETETKTASEPAGAASEHGGWWCTEHGVPEEECALCSATVAADFKKKGDWCKEHDRPESQCFICHPDLADKFAARYEAKFGKQPPARDQ